MEATTPIPTPKKNPFKLSIWLILLLVILILGLLVILSCVAVVAIPFIGLIITLNMCFNRGGIDFEKRRLDPVTKNRIRKVVDNRFKL